MSEEPKVRIPGYEIGERIAEGGFGVVWSAVSVVTRETVAIKVLHSELIGSYDIILRFKREADAIAQLRHPNVVELLQYGRLIDGRPFLVMEYLQGDNLAIHLEHNGPMTAEQTHEVLEPLCDALSSAHELGIVHRDLKASNVLLSREHETLRVVLLDFGIAKLIEHSGDPITAVRQAVGSPVCISPEQIRGEEVDSRTDVYGLGSLAFHMLTGSPPFEGEWVSVMDKHLFADRPRPSDRLDITTAFDDVVMRAMSLELEDRFDSAAQFLDAYRAAMDDAWDVSMEMDAYDDTGLPQRVIGCYLDVHADADVAGEPDYEMLDDMESIFPVASKYLGSRGYVLAYENGDSALFVAPCAEPGGQTDTTAARTLDMAIMLLERLNARESAHEHVRVNLFFHISYAELSRGGVSGGPILDATSWVIPSHGNAIFGTSRFCSGLEMDDAVTQMTGEIMRLYQC